jgi:transcriptional/translational regulatory protein YebC/TACO1
MVVASTDNRNRTVSDVRHIFSKNGGSLGEPGSAAYVFGSDPGNPQFRTPLTEDHQGQFGNLIEQLEENDDVEEVFNNAEI